MKKLELDQMEKIEGGGWNKCSWLGIAAIGVTISCFVNPANLVAAVGLTAAHLSCEPRVASPETNTVTAAPDFDF